VSGRRPAAGVARLTVVAGLAAGLLLCGCGGLPGAGGGVTAGARGPVKVALVDAFSGGPAGAAIGPALQNSLQLEIDDLNAHGGLLGSRVQLVTADDQYSPAAAPDVMRQVLADRAVHLVVGPSFAGLYVGVKPLIERARTPNCLTSMAADDVMARAPFSFRVQEPDRSRIPALLGYLQRSTQLRKVGLITEDDAVGQDADRQLSDQAPRAGLQYVGAAFVGAAGAAAAAPGGAAGAGDQKAQVQQMLKGGAEAVLLSGNPATASRTLLAIKAANAGARLRTFGFAGLASYGFAQQAGDAANGLILVSSIQSYLSDVPEARWPPAYRTFVRGALARYGPAANGVEMKGVPAAADCLLLWARAVRVANDFDGTRVAKAWETLDVPATQTVMGVREQFRPDAHDAVPADSLFVYQWTRNGDKWTLKQLAGAGA
jgi:branched-chain amino acid transport system substrate-binding protein